MTMRRTVAVLAVAGLILTLAAPVEAKKPPTLPNDPPELVEVTMTGALASLHPALSISRMEPYVAIRQGE